MNDDQALRRVLRIERDTRKLYEKRLRQLLTQFEFEQFRKNCRGEARRDAERRLPGFVLVNGHNPFMFLNAA